MVYLPIDDDIDDEEFDRIISDVSDIDLFNHEVENSVPNETAEAIYKEFEEIKKKQKLETEHFRYWL